MPYAQRDQQSSSFFHVYSRGADRQDIFCLDGDHAAFEALISEMVVRFNVEVHAYAWMSNHFHLLLHAPDGNLSEAMQFLLGSYARRLNHRTHRTGPVFDRRFGSVPIVGDETRSPEAHFAVAARYIHRNPLAFIAPQELATFPHSSLGAYLGSSDVPDWLSTELLAEMIDPKEYLDEVVEIDGDDLLPVGDLRPSTPVSVDALGDAVSVIAEQCLLDGVDGRLLAMTLAIELRIADLDSLASYFGVAMESVRRAARRGRIRLVDDAMFERSRCLVLAELTRRLRNGVAPVRFQPEEKRIA